MQVRRYIRAKRHRKSAGPRRKSLAPRASMINHMNLNIRTDNKLTIFGGSGSKGSHSKMEKELQGKHNILETGVGGLLAASNVGGSEGENNRNTGGVDPLYENWDEADLSSHNNVIIELVEIPHCILQGRGSGKTNGKKNSGTPVSSTVSVHHAKNSSSNPSSGNIPFMDGGGAETTNDIILENSAKDQKSTGKYVTGIQCSNAEIVERFADEKERNNR